MKDKLTVKIGGEAGQGVKSAGVLLAKYATRSGFHVYNHVEFPSLIRGGHNVIQVSIGQSPVTGVTLSTDILVALNQETVDRHLSSLDTDGWILFDPQKVEVKSSTVQILPVPLSRFAQEVGGLDLLSNSVALGALVSLIGGEVDSLRQLLMEEYQGKGEEVLQDNLKALSLGFEYAQKELAGKGPNFIEASKDFEPKMVLNGNEAVALGAIEAGMQFASIYPMSPISNILHVLASHQEEYGYIYKQPEDEIAAINQAIGASFAGTRAMTATSGGGFCLMTEGYGLAGMTETPLVIIEGMRGGPATGLPTWSGQGDLRFVLHAHQDDFPRIVLAAGDVKETYELTVEAFNLADKYQTPVVLLIDKNICENEQSFPMFVRPGLTNPHKDWGLLLEPREDYRRYAWTENGISPRALPGSGNYFLANSDEHDETGLTSEESECRKQQMEKRMRKLETCRREDMPTPQLYGPDTADITIISWGSNKGPILEAQKEFSNVNFLHLTWINPFPAEIVRKTLERARWLLNIEANYNLQMRSWIKEQTGIEIADNLVKYDGRPFFVEEIGAKINSILATLNG